MEKNIGIILQEHRQYIGFFKHINNVSDLQQNFIVLLKGGLLYFWE